MAHQMETMGRGKIHQKLKGRRMHRMESWKIPVVMELLEEESVKEQQASIYFTLEYYVIFWSLFYVTILYYHVIMSPYQ